MIIEKTLCKKVEYASMQNIIGLVFPKYALKSGWKETSWMTKLYELYKSIDIFILLDSKKKKNNYFAFSAKIK